MLFALPCSCFFWQNEPCEAFITSQIFLGRATLTTKPLKNSLHTFTFSHNPTSTTQLWLHASNLLEGFATEPFFLAMADARDFRWVKVKSGNAIMINARDELKVPIDKLSRMRRTKWRFVPIVQWIKSAVGGNCLRPSTCRILTHVQMHHHQRRCRFRKIDCFSVVFLVEGILCRNNVEQRL